MAASTALLAFPDPAYRFPRAERGPSSLWRAPSPARGRDRQPPAPLLRANGEVAQVSYGGEVRALPSEPGLRCLSTLVLEPGAEIPALVLERMWLVDLSRPAGRCALHDARLRARDAVRQAVSATLATLAAVHPAAAAHLRAHVHLDQLCRYDLAGDVGADPDHL